MLMRTSATAPTQGRFATPEISVMALIMILMGMLSRRVMTIPMIPDVNLTEDHFEMIARLAEELSGIREVQLEPYHPLGVQKSARLGREAAYANEQFLDKKKVEEYAEYIRSRTNKTIVVQ